MGCVSPSDGRLVNAVDLLLVLEFQVVGRDGQSQSGQSACQRAESDLQFGARILSDSLVRTVAEAEVSAGVAVDIEGVWIVDEHVVPVSGGQVHEHGITGTNQLTAESQVFGVHDRPGCGRW